MLLIILRKKSLLYTAQKAFQFLKFLKVHTVWDFRFMSLANDVNNITINKPVISSGFWRLCFNQFSFQKMQQAIAHDLDVKIRTKDVILEENVSFDSLLLPNNVLKGLDANGFRKPSPIQLKAIPLGRCGFDLIVKSKSGTGKTLVFAIIALETINVSKNHVQILILVPTREIAVQIQSVLKSIGSHIEGLKVESFIGGFPIEGDVKKIKDCHIAVGAPGRIKHLINLGAFSTEFIRLFVLDEADKLLETSFQSDINEIYNCLPQKKQLIASSATYPKELDTFLTNYMLSPTHVSCEIETPILLGLKQFVAVINSSPNVAQMMKTKNELLLEIFAKISFTQCLVFSNYQTRAESISNYLNQKGWNSSFISAAQCQTKRLEAVNNLKEFKSRILLSTDLTARGIDAPNVDLVINYDIPHDAVTYIHRMGRAGRYGSSGICINLALNGAELKQLQTILGTIGTTNLSISKLPSLNEEISDLWQSDPNKFEQIYGIVSANVSNQINEEIKNEILAFKQKGQGKTKSKNSGKKLKLNHLTSPKCVENILNIKKKELEDVCDKPENIDTETLLSSLISDENTNDNKKRKRISCNDFNEEKRINDTKHLTFCKNKALLSITKLLCDPETQINTDVIDSIEEYLQISKNKDTDGSNINSIEDILHADGDAVPKPHEDRKVVTEDIFKIGYESAIDKGGQKWSDYLSQEELHNFQEICKSEIQLSSDTEDDEEEDYEMDGYAEEEEEIDDQNVTLQWVPVAEDESKRYSEHYAKCYEDCSDILWQNGLTFENVENFDDWFYDWQLQLQSVRNYVQQNIYVEEMSKYQQNRLTNK